MITEELISRVESVPEPAFPIIGGNTVHHLGMSLRDWFAGQAIAGMVPDSAKNKAEAAYAIADAMLAARTKETRHEGA